jgi:VWFA-related protein
MRATLLAALLSFFGILPASAQNVVGGAEAELVQLDAVVTDRDGKLIQGLSREDFVVLEDGRPQSLSHFVLVRRAPATASEAASSSAAPAAPAAPETAPSAVPHRNIVIIVDDLHMAAGNSQYAKQALAQLVESFDKDDAIALLTTSPNGVLQELTRDRDVLARAIGRLELREAIVAPARSTQLSAAQAELILRGDRSALELAGRTMVAEPGSVLDTQGPRAALEATSGGGRLDPNESRQRAAEEEAKRQARGILAEALHFSSVTLGRITDALRNMAALPGRKICLLVSDGFLVALGTSEERTRDLQAIADAAVRSGAVVYALESRGLVPTGGDASTAGSGAPAGLQTHLARQTEELRRGTLRSVADLTGGFLVANTNDLTGGLRRMLADNDAYYLMAYVPLNAKRDGHFRKLEVKVPGHAEYVVRSRKGYFAPDGKQASLPPLDEASARAALEKAPPASAPLSLAADYVELPAGPQAVVRARIDLKGVTWRKNEGRQQATLDLLGGVYDAAGKPTGPLVTKRVELDLPAAEQKRAVAEGLPYQQQLPLGPGRYEVRLLVRDAKLAVIGGARTSLEIPDLGDKKLALSGVFLSASAVQGGAEAVRGSEVGRHFKRSETLYFQLYVYNPLADDKGAFDVVLQAQLRSAGKLVAASKPQPVVMAKRDGLPLPETNSISLASLEPGSYELRVVVVDRKAQLTTQRNVDLQVE